MQRLRETSERSGHARGSCMASRCQRAREGSSELCCTAGLPGRAPSRKGAGFSPNSCSPVLQGCQTPSIARTEQGQVPVVRAKGCGQGACRSCQAVPLCAAAWPCFPGLQGGLAGAALAESLLQSPLRGTFRLLTG